MKKLDTRRILNISDQHMPYHHKDMFAFLKEVKRVYKPTLVINGGDEVDGHALSFHEHNPNLPSASTELDMAIKSIKTMEKMFPEMIILDSNHGSLAVRRAVNAGLPNRYLATPNTVYGVSKKWQWVNDLTITLPNGKDCYYAHGIVKDGKKLAQQRGVNVVQFHFHTEFRIDYCGNPNDLLFSINSGCLIDRKSLAFAYDKLNLNRPIIGVSLIIDSKPILVPMVLDRDGNWIGKL